tara:strand:- start:1782 stop:2213 length:432 start_codon:yes stop_codon:yes gene_type:complete
MNECPSAAWERHYTEEEAKASPNDEDFLASSGLDAYGHLTWTVGNDDWIACFDAVLSPDKTRIAYHAVVNCESGGFIDTIESGVVRIEDANKLLNLPDSYLDSCCEQYMGDYDHPIDINQCQKSIEFWNQHIEHLIRAAKEDA